MTRSIIRLASVYHECLSVVYLLVCTHVYLSVCKLSTVCVLICLSIILCMCACPCVCMSVGLSACLCVYRSVWTRSVSVSQSDRHSVGLSIGQSVYVSVCVLLSVSTYLSLTAESALATKHPMAWLACILLLLTSANRLII
jgi:hypothetical protein